MGNRTIISPNSFESVTFQVQEVVFSIRVPALNFPVSDSLTESPS